MRATNLTKALQNWENQHNGQSYTEATEIKLCFQVTQKLQFPPIQKLETAVLNTLTKCQKLSFSSNMIDKMVNFPPLKNLTRLSLSRNLIKKISGLDDIGGNLKQLWLSYNQIQKLQGLSMCTKLVTFFIGSFLSQSDNRIRAWQQLDKIKELSQLENVIFIGNPFFDNVKDEARCLILKKLPNLKNIDGHIVTKVFQTKSQNMPDTFPPPIKI